MMEEPNHQECYVCGKEGIEEVVTEIDGREHVFFVHKRKGSAGRPKKCDAGYNETETEFMEALESGTEDRKTNDLSKKSVKHAKKYTGIAVGATTEVFVKMFMHTCQRCNFCWTTKKQFPLVCSNCTSRNWNKK